MPEPVKVALGDHELDVYPQRHAYLANKLGRFITRLGDSGHDLEASDILSFGQGTVYELLAVVIPQMPKRLPEYEFRGYASKEALDKGEYEPQADKSPTIPEIEYALEVVSKVNRFDIVRHLAKLIDPDLLRSLVSKQIAGQILKTSPSLPSTSGGSAKTNSGTKRQTKTASTV